MAVVLRLVRPREKPDSILKMSGNVRPVTMRPPERWVLELRISPVYSVRAEALLLIEDANCKPRSGKQAVTEGGITAVRVRGSSTVVPVV